MQPGRDVTGAAIALFTAQVHSPVAVTHKTTLQGTFVYYYWRNYIQFNEFVSHKFLGIILQIIQFSGVVFQLDAALTSPETQKSGLIFIYDMSGSKYSNFDYDLSQKILTLLKVSEYELF